jgi:hypothetical protein
MAILPFTVYTNTSVLISGSESKKSGEIDTDTDPEKSGSFKGEMSSPDFRLTH